MTICEILNLIVIFDVLVVGVVLLSILPDLAEFRYDQFILDERLKYLSSIDPEEFDIEKYEAMCRERPVYQVHNSMAYKGDDRLDGIY